MSGWSLELPGKGRFIPSRGVALALFLCTLLLTAGCGDGGPVTPGRTRPVLLSISPSSVSPLESPLNLTLRGENLMDVELAGPPFLFLEVLHRSQDRMQLRAGFGGGPPGPAWVTVSNSAGRDSLSLTISALDYADSLSETRALWVSRFEYASPGDVVSIMERAGEAGFNLVYFQVRGRADAFYRSSFEPWAANLTGTLGQDPGWDPLGLAVEEGNARGLEVHAWINAFTGWAGSTPPPSTDPLHAFLEHPEWVMVDADGLEMPYQSGSRWMTPGHPGVRTRLARVAADIVRKYDVGGVHLDFIRYPNTDHSFDAASLAAFDSVRGEEPGLGFDEMRRRFVTWAVQEVRDSIQGADPEAALSAAVWGVYQNWRGWSGVSTGFGSVLQDAREWDRLGIVDALVPMVYWTITPSYGERLDFAYLADEHASTIDTSVFVGMYVPGMDGRTLAQHVERARMAGSQGISVFSYSALDSEDLWGALRTWAFFWPARRVE